MPNTVVDGSGARDELPTTLALVPLLLAPLVGSAPAHPTTPLPFAGFFGVVEEGDEDAEVVPFAPCTVFDLGGGVLVGLLSDLVLEDVVVVGVAGTHEARGAVETAWVTGTGTWARAGGTWAMTLTRLVMVLAAGLVVFVVLVVGTAILAVEADPVDACWVLGAPWPKPSADAAADAETTCWPECANPSPLIASSTTLGFTLPDLRVCVSVRARLSDPVYMLMHS